MDTRIVLLSGLFLCHVASFQELLHRRHLLENLPQITRLNPTGEGRWARTAPSEEILPEPYNVSIESMWNLTWTPGMEDKTVTYMVEYRSFNSQTWLPLPECVNISTNFCDFSPTTNKSDHRCIMLRVQAEQNGRKSVPVQACSTRGSYCRPEFSMTAAPGSITIHLNRESRLYLDYAEHSQHRIYFGKEGEKLKSFKYAASSEFIGDLEVGQKYCAMVEFILYDKPIGTASCVQCKTIPAPNDSKRTVTIVTVVVVVVLLVLVPIIAYMLIYQPKTIKEILKPRYHIPNSLLPSAGETVFSHIPSGSNREDYDLISVMTPQESRRD